MISKRKLEESPQKIPAVLNVFHRLDRRREDAPLELLDPISKKYEEMKTKLITTKRYLLKKMGFICHDEHPHKEIHKGTTQTPLKIIKSLINAFKTPKRPIT